MKFNIIFSWYFITEIFTQHCTAVTHTLILPTNSKKLANNGLSLFQYQARFVDYMLQLSNNSYNFKEICLHLYISNDNSFPVIYPSLRASLSPSTSNCHRSRTSFVSTSLITTTNFLIVILYSHSVKKMLYLYFNSKNCQCLRL